MIAAPVVKVTNNGPAKKAGASGEHAGQVKFSVDAVVNAKNDMWVNPGANKSHDTVGGLLNKVKIRYYPADGSAMKSADITISSEFNSVSFNYEYSVDKNGALSGTTYAAKEDGTGVSKNKNTPIAWQ
jgi:hypothetical protein